MDIVNNQKESSKMDSELLFLITQTLKSIDGFADAAALVEQRLVSLH